MDDEIKSRFLKRETQCYFCGDTLHNFTTEKLADGRIVTSCYECHRTVELGKQHYYSKAREVAAS
ncbi:MAG: hypothetical protein OEW78_05160 [Nitrosopumilus sp.]|uniref:hypothetical protein n=1 Tax=Nitrosopumilus sp. TaxID=2024843 RepID=UPI00246F0F6C|nr:hypothetical protein [Nitrosopumilus sp.]MDH5431256.1 hypothetical protein [Nitrosopumilus sp.]